MTQVHRQKLGRGNRGIIRLRKRRTIAASGKESNRKSKKGKCARFHIGEYTKKCHNYGL